MESINQNQTIKNEKGNEMTLEALVEVGFSNEEANYLANNKDFHHKRKIAKELNEIFYNISKIYKCDVDDIKKSVLNHPPFVGYNHSRVLKDAIKVYGKKNEIQIKRIILKYPQFAGLNHYRVLRQKTKVGKLVGFNKNYVINIILKKPVNAGYSYKRDLARIDVVRSLQNDGLKIRGEIKEWFIRKYMTSPYSKGTRLRVSKAKGLPEPKLLTIARKKFMNYI